MKPLWIPALAALHAASCEQSMESANQESPERLVMESYGKLPDGREVTLFTLTNKNRLRARIIDYGAILMSLEAPDREGTFADVTLGYDRLEDWRENPEYLGATVGRFGNRIAGGTFVLDGQTHQLATNDPPNHLHGGSGGFHKRLWKARPVAAKDGTAVEFRYMSEDGEENYPGTLHAKVTYTLTDADELIWRAEATAEAATIVNLVHHSYWNLGGNPALPVLDHELTLNADRYLPIDATFIPTGEMAAVAGTPMDFRKGTAIARRIEDDSQQLRNGRGYDHCYVLNGGPGIRHAATLHSPRSGRTLEISTDQPGLQFYSGNFLGEICGKNNLLYPKHGGLCLETQRFPDSPNQPQFPSAILRPGETYRHVMIHKFSVK